MTAAFDPLRDKEDSMINLSDFYDEVARRADTEGTDPAH